jgi:ribosomal protein L37AE/L43A
MTSKYKHFCRECGEPVKSARYALGYKLCLLCGEEKAVKASKKFTILTPHKQGAMYFTAEFAREAAMGINNKGGLIK